MRIAVLTTSDINFNIEEIQNKILAFAKNNNVGVNTRIEMLSMKDFLNVQDYENVLFMKPLDYKNFTIENGKLK